MATPSGTATITYDALGRMATITPPGGSEVILHYLGTSATPAHKTVANHNLLARWLYNSADHPVLMITPTHVYGYVYDGRGNGVGLVAEVDRALSARRSSRTPTMHGGQYPVFKHQEFQKKSVRISRISANKLDTELLLDREPLRACISPKRGHQAGIWPRTAA